MSKLTDTIEAYETARTQLSKLAKDDVLAAFLEAFESAPLIRAFSWRQYTPSFNDGDPCVFRSYADEDEFKLVDEEHSQDDPEVARQHGLLEAVYNQLPHELLEDMFGDNTRVHVTRDGFDIDDYDCGY